LAALVVLSTACSRPSPLDGKYYNSETGTMVMELKRGKVVFVAGLPGKGMTYEVKGDSLVLHHPKGGPGDGVMFGIEKDGTLSFQPMGSLTKIRPDSGRVQADSLSHTSAAPPSP
jgi:hypothetical protein